MWFESVNEQKVFKKGTKENDDVDEEKIDSVKEYMRRYRRAELKGLSISRGHIGGTARRQRGNSNTVTQCAQLHELRCDRISLPSPYSRTYERTRKSTSSIIFVNIFCEPL